MPRQNPDRKKIIVGLTGSFGSGKTTVAGMFKSFGAEIIDADKIARAITRPGSAVAKKVLTVFGTLNRDKIGRLAFNNRGLLKKLNNITHPEVIKIIKNRIRNARPKIVILDAPLLIEAGLRKLVDKLIVVKINRAEQIRRLENKTLLTKTDILKRIRSQIPLRKKVRLADFVIDNSATLERTKKQVKKVRRKLGVIPRGLN